MAKAFSEHTEDIELFVPGFFCNQSLYFARKKDMKISFYPIQTDFSVDSGQLGEILNSSEAKVKIVIGVHYFGFENQLEQVVQTCKQNNATLIEDCAHVLHRTGNISNYSDTSFYSPHKLVAVPDGSLLVTTNSILKNHIIEHSSARSLKPGFQMAWQVKKIVQRILKDCPELLDRSSESDFSQDLPTTDYPDLEQMTDFSIALLNRHIESFERISKARQKNYKRLASFFSHHFETMCPIQELNPDTVPYILPIRFHSHQDTVAMFNSLNKKIPIAQSWPDLPPEVKNAPDSHSAAINLRNTLITIPVHQDLDIERLIRFLERELPR